MPMWNAEWNMDELFVINLYFTLLFRNQRMNGVYWYKFSSKASLSHIVMYRSHERHNQLVASL